MRQSFPLILISCALAVASPLAQSPPPRPNVILIITDDMGYGDLGSYGSPDIKTPNIDGLAKAGVRFTQFYANASSCTPTRAGLISGRYQQRFTLERPLSHASSTDGNLGLPATGRSLPQLLQNHGYATALIGKWHLGYLPQFSPKAHGFGSFFGFKAGYVDYYQHTDASGASDLFENDTPVKVNGYMTDLITDRSVSFIESNAKSPFFLEVAYSVPHWPYQVPDRPSTAIDNSRHIVAHDDQPNTRADYVKMLEHADRAVGRILSAIDRTGIAANTLVIFTNDNGGEWLSSNAPFFNRKFTLYEGGIRVPALMRWPGRIPAGVITSQVGITMDLTATILAAAGAAVPADARLEGINLLPLIGKDATPVARTLFWRVATAGLNQRAVRDGDWKLLVDGTARQMLFDLSKDVGERNDVAAANTGIVRRLRQQLVAWEKDVDSEAKAPSP
ncbi:MAG TPA: sulfatase-like hydrolase/transferase [Vicinamibacterales bacterium]